MPFFFEGQRLYLSAGAWSCRAVHRGPFRKDLSSSMIPIDTADILHAERYDAPCWPARSFHTALIPGTGSCPLQGPLCVACSIVWSCRMIHPLLQQISAFSVRRRHILCQDAELYTGFAITQTNGAAVSSCQVVCFAIEHSFCGMDITFYYFDLLFHIIHRFISVRMQYKRRIQVDAPSAWFGWCIFFCLSAF